MPICLLAAVLLLPGWLHAASTMRYGRFEQQFTSAKTYAHPLQEASLVVTFTAPSGKRYPIRGFWDGGRTWKVRFSPSELGTWRYETNSPDREMQGRKGQFSCVAYRGTNPLYRHGSLRVAEDRIHFIQNDGEPFFWLADTVWNGPLLASREDWKKFLEDRSNKGFNVIQFVTTQWTAADGDAEGRTAFQGRQQIDVDPAFFQRLDERINAINDHGLLAAPVLLWAHANRKEVNPGLSLPDEQAIALARYIMARYGAHQVVWLLNGDGQYLGENAPRWKRIGRAVSESEHPDRLMTLHPGGLSWVRDEYATESWFSFNGYQSGHRGDDTGMRWLVAGPPSLSWKARPRMPDVNLEPNYEAHAVRFASTPETYTDYHVRRAAYWSLLIGAPAGVTYGAHGIWSWQSEAGEPLNHKGTGVAPKWDEAMQLPGSQQIGALKRFFSSLTWWSLRPAPELLAEQPGEKEPALFQAAARSEDNRHFLLYLPKGGRAVLTQRLPGALRWVNPRTGEYHPARAAQATDLSVTAPDEQDWLLFMNVQQ